MYVIYVADTYGLFVCVCYFSDSDVLDLVVVVAVIVAVMPQGNDQVFNPCNGYLLQAFSGGV